MLGLTHSQGLETHKKKIIMRGSGSLGMNINAYIN